MSQPKRAVILANLGAPSNPDDVQPFLKNLFADPDIFNFPLGKFGQEFFSSLIAWIRAPKSRKLYADIGGGSPLHANTVMQAEKLAVGLKAEGNFTILVAQRYWHPFFSEIAEQIRRDDYDWVMLLPLYPHYSTTTTLSIVNEWKRKSNIRPNCVVERFYSMPSFIDACAENIENSLAKAKNKPHLLFSAHSIPRQRVDEGDPYEQEIIEHMELIMDRLGRKHEYSLCYQSKVGPVKWLGPDIDNELERLADAGTKSVLIYPISFVSEHLETLQELDIRKKKIADELGFEEYIRVPTVQDSERFISTLKEIVLEAIK